MNKKRMLVAFAVSALVSWLANATLAQEPFYKGKTIRVVVATSAGGGFDAYTRMMTRHMGKSCPRIVQTQPVHDQQTENNSVAQLIVLRESVGEIAISKESR